jgi:hypothetical protein
MHAPLHRSRPEPVALARTLAQVPPHCAEPAHLHITVHPFEAQTRGRLREFIDEAIERELACHGAPAPDATSADATTRLRDQQYRARLLGYHGITLELRDLDAVATNGVLDVADGQALAWWLDNTEDPALDVAVAESVQQLKVYTRPVLVAQWMLGLASSRPPTIPAPALEARSDGGDGNLPGQEEEGLDDEAPRSETIALAATLEPEPAPPAACEPDHASIWREALERADGTQSWDGLERLYVGNYLPLAHLASDGRASVASQSRMRDWADDFQQCYQSAFARLRSGAPRPTMVLDVPQLAFSLLREFEATQIRLVLVDGLRFDLGQRVHDKLRLQLLGHANCVQRRVLWAALPATTAVQLELLARGPCALGRTMGDLDERAWLARGAEARKLRALRVGPHQLRKLDILEAEFARAEWTSAELERAAAEVAVSTGRYIRQQSAGTLVVVFGDHGLAGGPGARAASPEQVLVPFDAWLVHDSADN